MFGTEILNGKQLREKLGISTTIYYRLLKNGMPYKKLTANSRRYFEINEVKKWLQSQGFSQKEVWTR